jgi:hypothetical protein
MWGKFCETHPSHKKCIIAMDENFMCNPHPFYLLEHFICKQVHFKVNENQCNCYLGTS